MRFLLSAALVASVSLAAFAPAQACDMACSMSMGSGSGGGGGSVSSTTGGGTSAQTSNTSDGSSESENHGLPGHGSSSAIAVFIDSNSTVEQASNLISYHGYWVTSEIMEQAKDLYQATYDYEIEKRLWERPRLDTFYTLADILILASVAGVSAVDRARSEAKEARDEFLAEHGVAI